MGNHHQNKLIILSLSLFISVKASPFELTDAYVNTFKAGLDDLKSLSHSYIFEQSDSHPGTANETEIITDPEEYDFIIIGSGAAGSALANRLSEVPEWNVLVLEAGAPETEASKVPVMKPYLQTTPFDWSYTTTSQEKSCLGMEEHKCSVPSGKALGGNTAVDDMIFTRGNPRDYDLWADLGLEKWCWNDLLPYFKKIEDAHIPELDRKYHNLGGPIHLEHFQKPSDLQAHILQAGHEVGIKTLDINGKEQLGLGVPQSTTKNGKRNSVAQSYLLPAHKRANLEVKPYSQVVQILISPHSKEATGVKYLHDGKLRVAKAAKEIVLAAGAIESPKLLMLSGIGPKEILEPFGIATLSDLKVGQTLKDHLSFIGLNFILNETIAVKDEKYDEVIDYLRNGKGPLTNPGIEVVGYVKTEASREKHDQPDVELLFTNSIYNKGKEHLRSLRIAQETYDALWKPIEGAVGFTIQVILLHPKSTGFIKLHDKDALHHPLIDTHSLTDPDERDVETLLAGINNALKLAHSETFQKLGVKLNPHKLPACEHFEKNDYWKCAIRHLSTNLGEITGTVRMGKQPEEGACVDDQLRVHGIHKLRVADSSIIPVTISGHLSAVNAVIGERAADILKQHHK